ncbi:hypothetical protein [Paenibacillus sp. UASWS1643]|uniref:hypothetical protein n=1 Tax=Paenibacillus sp. UASWS1643 TaxID=2580422 RepID=UPI00168392BE|nr:hypothetical protein [Paenibacillus sp. UASWS1643]
MIEMDEDEYQESVVSDDTLHLVSIFCGPEVRDKLLYRRVDDVRLHSGFDSHIIQERPDPKLIGCGRFFDPKTAKNEGSATEIPALDVPG